MPYRILVVDDEEGVRKSLRLKLGKSGYDVLSAQDGQEAIDLIESGEQFDVILSDIMMPRVDGEAFVKWIKEKGLLTPVVMLTALVEVTTAVTLMKMGAIDYLVKPINFDALLVSVQNAIKYKEIVEENIRLEDENRRYQANLENMVKEQTDTIRLMLEFASRINSLVEMDEVLDFMLDYVHKSTGSDNTLIMLLGEEGDGLAVKRATGLMAHPEREVALKLTDALVSRVFEEGSLVTIDDIPASGLGEEHVEMFGALGTPQVWAPLIDPKKRLGIIVAGARSDKSPFDEEHMKILSYISGAGAVAISNAGLYSETQLQATRERNIRHIFQKYVPEDVVAELISKGEEELMGLGESKEVSLLNLDLRGYSHLAQEVDAATVVKILNMFFSVMGEVVFKHKGIVDKYLGDGFLALFGAPVSHGNDSVNAILAAVEMRERMDEVREYSMRLCGRPLSLGIAVNTGQVIAGNIGFDKKMEYTVIGEAVNTAFRIEALTHGHPDTVLISKPSYERAKDIVEVKPWGEVAIDESTTVTVFEVLDRLSQG